MERPFNMFELTTEKSTEFAASPSKPHRHDFEEIVLVTEGKPYHFIDFKKEQLTAPVVLYIAMGKIHQFLPDNKTKGWVLQYNNEFIPETSFHFYSNFIDNLNCRLKSKECIENLESMCKIMLYEFSQESINYKMIRHLLIAFLSKLESMSNRNTDSEMRNPELITLNNFLKILDENFRRDKGVEFYAEKMNMSARSLNNICKNLLEKSVSEIIESRKLTEARQLLLNTNKTISEIGFELGYNEKSYFTRVFHKKTGLTPTAFKEKMQEMLA